MVPLTTYFYIKIFFNMRIFFYCDPKPLWRAVEKKTSSTVIKNNAMKVK